MLQCPVILVLDDERPQLLSLQASLRDLGRVVGYTNPHEALEFARSTRIDTAIVDLRMPAYDMDGHGFMAAFRQFDKDAAIIVRTADESAESADGAIAARACRRVLKTKTTNSALRAVVMAAIDETRIRRALIANASIAPKLQEHLNDALGSLELEVTAADACRGIVHSLRNHITAVSGMADLMCELAASPAEPFANDKALLTKIADRNRAIIVRMLADMDSFLDGPFAKPDRSPGSRALANQTLSALEQHFRVTPRWLGEKKAVQIRRLLDDVEVSTPPFVLLNTLRHMVEFVFERVDPPAGVSLKASLGSNVAESLPRANSDAIVINRSAASTNQPYVGFSICGAMRSIAPSDMERALSRPSEDPRCGNLMILAQTIVSHRGIAVFKQFPKGESRFDLYLPIAA